MSRSGNLAVYREGLRRIVDSDRAELAQDVGAEKAREASVPTLEAMYERMGFARP